MRAYLSLGSNIQPQKNIPACLKKLKEAFRVRKVSSIYETSPVGPSGPAARKGPRPVGKQKFWNLAVEIETRLPRPRLVRALRRIEYELGRVRSPRRFAPRPPKSQGCPRAIRRCWRPRPIDIDLVLCRGWSRKGFEGLGFVLIPLAEIAPLLKPGGFGSPLGALAGTFRAPGQKIQKRKKGTGYFFHDAQKKKQPVPFFTPL